MNLTYTLTFEDYKAAQRLHRRQSLLSIASFYFWFVIIPILTIIGIVAVILNESHPFLKSGALLWGVEGGLLWLSIYLPAWRAYAMRKCFKQIFPPARTDNNSSIDIDDDRIISSVPGVSEGKFFWTGIVAFAQDEKITLLYIRKNAFLFFPTQVMSTNQRTELNDLVARHLLKRKS